MQGNLKKQILDTLLIVLRPIVRILLRYNIGYREFMEVTKTAYVDIASSDFGIRGRPTNISRVAVMTGLTRKEVKRLRDKITVGGNSILVKTTPLADVLHHWHAEKEFVASSGKPRTLPFNGDGTSFSSLVRKFGGDIPAGAMRTEMKRVGAVTENSDGSLTVVERTFRPSEDHNTLVTALVHAAYPVLSNIEHNTNPERNDETWVNRVAFTRLVDSNESGRLCRIAKDRIVNFAESVDDIFMAYESLQVDEKDIDERRNQNTIAVGVFYFEEKDAKARYQW